MSEDNESPLEKKINRLGESKWVVIGIPMLAVFGVSLKSLRAGTTLFFFFLLVWVAIGVTRRVLRLTDKLYPESISAALKKEVQGSIFFTLICVLFTIPGIILRGDNAFSEFVEDHGAGKMSFIDPIFALVLVVGVWTYTLYKITK
ncbi:MAG: hypothetical protein AAF340_13815 [Pseudomonadota bacterium]